ncbi:uncharacterized protein HaLaN_02552, partial [Haematococcus lacustris]
MVFAGDDTWLQLLPPALFSQALPLPSLNIHDLHTVDDGVWQALQQYLSAPWSWDLLAVHYLGVDHAGHSHGVNSPAMALKLQQLDRQVEQVAEQLVAQAAPGQPFSRTLLLLLSDHANHLPN